MKIICAWHRPEPIVIGENCPTPGCGVRARVSVALDLAFCENPNCPTLTFPLGEGGISHSICPDCKAAMLADPEHSEKASAA
jgi:hypothetical protein